MRVAIIDIGTVTTRLLIADVASASDGADTAAPASAVNRADAPAGSCGDALLRCLCARAIITHLGEGLRESGRLSSAAMQRVADAIRSYQEDMRRFAPIQRHMVVATSASRDASNSQEFAELIASLGFSLSIIPGSEEARLGFAGVCSAFPRVPAPLLVMDVGGGSTELILGDPAKDSGIICARSFDVGCRRLTDACLHSDPYSPEELAAAHELARNMLAGYIAAFPQQPKSVISVAGSASGLVSVLKGIEVYDRDAVHGSFVSRRDLDEIYQRVSPMSLTELKQLPGLQPERAGVFTAGLIIIKTIFELLPEAEGFIMSESDILQGIALELAR